MKRAALLVAVLGLASTGFSQKFTPNPKLKSHVGKPLPKFSMDSTKGTKLTNASLKGKVVLLDFWATYCGPCVAMGPYMQKLHTNYGGKGLTVLGADTFEDGRSAAPAYSKRHGYTYTFALKGDDLALKLGVEGLPAFVLVDKKGVVRKVWTGIYHGLPGLYSEIEAAAKPLLK